MHNKTHSRTTLIVSLVLAVLISVSSSIGLFSNNFYAAETMDWQTQAIGQDLVDLFVVVPALLVFSSLYWSAKSFALPIYGGILLYIIYTFLIYCFSVHFNSLFIVYCLILGLSFYGFCYVIFNASAQTKQVAKTNGIMNTVAVYFIVIACLFYLLWLIQIIPSIINNTTPAELMAVGLFTNPVHVIDLSVCLPGIFLTALFILKAKSVGFFLAPAILTFMILMDITIGFLAWLMKYKGVADEAMMVYVMTALALFSLYLLMRISRTSVHRTFIE
jgi:hypothetical protein